jgi:hypothetical protein
LEEALVRIEKFKRAAPVNGQSKKVMKATK